MRNVIGGLVLTMGFLATPAFADSTHVCQGNSCNQGTNNHVEGDYVNNITNKPTAIGIGGKGGDADARARANAKAESKAKAGAEALATQSQAQTAAATNAGNSQQINVGGTSYDRYAPPAYAPGLTSAGTGVCLGSVSIGLSGPMAGASFGITKVDKGCERRSGAALLFQMGYQDAAIKLLSNDAEIREAMGLPSRSVGIEGTQGASVQPAIVQGGN